MTLLARVCTWRFNNHPLSGQGNWCFGCLARRIEQCEVPHCQYDGVGTKEPDFVMIIMTIYGTLGEFGEEKNTTWSTESSM